MKRVSSFFVAAWCASVLAAPLSARSTIAPAASGATTAPVLAPPVIEGRWLRPGSTTQPAIPEWGHADGLRVGLAPLPGPRGLLRIYAPYLDQQESRVINFIAVEPMPVGQDRRGLSELERSALDGKNGKRFWSADAPSNHLEPRLAEQPSCGVIETRNGVEQLSVIVHVEPFENGASVYLRLLFRADRPREVGIAVFGRPESKPLKQCIVTATMGNFARLRRLELADRVVSPSELWPAYKDDGFTPHATFPLAEMQRDADGAAYVSATSDESNPTAAEYAPGTRSGWHYQGLPARQHWRMFSPPAGLTAMVNGRFTYWASQSPIPGGVSFENFELASPFEQGQEFWFGVEPLEPGSDRPKATSPDSRR